MKKLNETAKEKSVIWRITKYANDADKKAGKAYDVSEFEGNALVNVGINYFLTMIGTDAKTGTPFGNADAKLVVGTGSGAEDAGDTVDTFTAGVFQAMEVGYPTYGSSQKITWKSSYDGDTANQDWQEFGVVNGEDDELFNRKVSDQGTKTSGQTWELELEITFS